VRVFIIFINDWYSFRDKRRSCYWQEEIPFHHPLEKISCYEFLFALNISRRPLRPDFTNIKINIHVCLYRDAEYSAGHVYGDCFSEIFKFYTQVTEFYGPTRSPIKLILVNCYLGTGNFDHS
jgi:hypothetical protein